jgi:3-oxoacyl-[acyl-carrier protein] reductase
MLKNKVAIVTGSSRGIGAAIARALAAHGAKVAVNYVAGEDRAHAVAADVAGIGGKAITVRADVTVPSDVTRMVLAVEAELGPIDILVNNAVASFPWAPFVGYRWEDFSRKVESELTATFHTVQAVAPGMIQRGHGCIVNLSSELARLPVEGCSAHATAKSAVEGLTRALAVELGPLGIRVNAVAPGFTLTDSTKHSPQEMIDGIKAHAPLRRIAEPDDIAGAVLFLCSDQARHVTGACLPVGGGLLLS